MNENDNHAQPCTPKRDDGVVYRSVMARVSEKTSTLPAAPENPSEK